MLMKLLVSVFERARSKLTVTRSSNHLSSDSDIETTNFDSKGSTIIQHQPRSSLSKWLCTTPTSVDKPISSLRTNKVRRSSSWRSLKERGNNSITSRTYSVDELHKNHKQFQKIRRRDPSHSPIKNLTYSHGARSHARFDRLSSTLVNYSNSKKKSPHRKQFEQQIFSTLSHHSGGDSGYSEESFATRSFQRPLHTACPHCHCEQRSSFNNYKKLLNNSSTESSPSDIIILNRDRRKSSENLLSSRSYSHIKSIQKLNHQSQQRLSRTLTDKRRRNLSCDGSLWTRPQTQKPIILTSSPVLSEPNRLPLQRHFTTIGMTHCHPINTYAKTSNVFGELNLAAIELDSLRTSFTSSSYSSSSSSSINKEKNPEKQLFLVWHEYQNSSLLSKTNPTKIFSVKRGDQVRLLKRIGKSTLLVQKEDDATIGFLPQTCLAPHQINSFLSLKGLRETVL